MKPKAFGYARVSTNRQVEEGVSLQFQKECIKEFYTTNYQNTHDWGGLYAEPKGVSASKVPFHKRPSGKIIMREARKDDIIIVAKPDRIFRSIEDFAITTYKLNKQGIHFVILDLCGQQLDTSTPMGKFYLNSLMIFAQLESDLRSQRIKDAYKTKLTRREKMGVLPKGFKRTPKKRIVVDPAFRRMAEKLFSMACYYESYNRVRLILEKRYRDLRGEPFMPKHPGYKWRFSKLHINRAIAFAVEVLDMDPSELSCDYVYNKRNEAFRKYKYLADTAPKVTTLKPFSPELLDEPEFAFDVGIVDGTSLTSSADKDSNDYDPLPEHTCEDEEYEQPDDH